MDESIAANGDRWGVAGGDGGDGGGLVLFHTGVRARGLHADSAGAFLARGARGPVGGGLPVLSQRGGAFVVFECPGGEHVHELSQPGAEG